MKTKSLLPYFSSGSSDNYRIIVLEKKKLTYSAVFFEAFESEHTL